MEEKLITLLDLIQIDKEIVEFDAKNGFELLDEDPEYHEWLNKMSEQYDNR